MPMKFKTQTSYIQRLEDKTTKETRNKKPKQTQPQPNSTTIHKEKLHFHNRKDLGSIENDKSRWRHAGLKSQFFQKPQTCECHKRKVETNQSNKNESEIRAQAYEEKKGL